MDEEKQSIKCGMQGCSNGATIGFTYNGFMLDLCADCKKKVDSAITDINEANLNKKGLKKTNWDEARLGSKDSPAYNKGT